ncbi:MAG: hypothetical protein QW410_03680 [Nitrososphaerota archaeon]
MAVRERTTGRTGQAEFPEVGGLREEWISSLRELEVIRDAMVHVTRNLLMGIVDRATYLDLMTRYYDGIRRILLNALESNYPNEFFQSYSEVFSEPSVTKLVTFLMMSYERAKLTHKEVRWCSLVLQGNVADAGPPPVQTVPEETAPKPAATTAEPPRTALRPTEPPVKGEAVTTEAPRSAAAEESVVIDEYTEFFEHLVAERDRLPERERPIVYIGLLGIAYARGRIDREVLVKMGNEYLERAKGADVMWLNERTRSVMKRLASVLKRRGDVPKLIIQLLEKPELISSGRELRIEE